MKNGSKEAFLDKLNAAEVRLLPEEIEMLRKKHGGINLNFLEGAIAEGLVAKDKACRLWGDTEQCAYVNPLVAIVTPEAIEAIPKDIALKAHTIGLYTLDGVLTVAMAQPNDQAMVRRLEAITSTRISPVFALPSEIRDAIEIQYTTEEGINEDIQAFEASQRALLGHLSETDLKSLSESASVIKILDALILYAIRERASDIHMEPLEDMARVRLRVDGKLETAFRFSHGVFRAFVARLKVVCKLNIAESRFPQDGRYSIKMGLRSTDLRVSFLPTIYGNKVVLRVLASASKKEMITLDRMLMSQNVLQPFRRLIQSPNGIIFVTGPTGSGKTTTLYAALNELNTPDTNISTIEDPVEIRMEGLIQCQVNSAIELKFSTILRSLLRQDPDILLVGEIRDLETAKIATEAALTGHLVLSTLHTNTAIQAIVRLVEIGIEPYMVAPAIIGVLAQRLAARICEKCKESYEPSPEVLERYFDDIPEDRSVSFYQGTGCKGCRGGGFRGRVAFHELVLVSDEMRSLISAGAGTHELIRAARKLGYRSLRYDGLKKVLLGLTTIDQIEKQSVVEWAD